ncbi:Uma2 family endonuclease [Dyadobacter sp. CY261]|uniref:Uma2 family endonuclease n=1 Tax=Dyadobacter sp. CY261 TaxID=2907203 RepID=UPI001F2D3D68|nr:Uma2 family endonuclease [Dyadobacter sp. CY261]MCF0069511.1 Uma2 family endonuclease [Dyadobacter sp. CY261]
MTVLLAGLSKKTEENVPGSLIREVIAGEAYYYKGYKDVIAGTIKAEEIMGSSALQSVLIMALGFFIKSKLDNARYWLATNEAGLHLGPQNNLSIDLGIFRKEEVSLNNQYFTAAPEVAIEVDVRIDTDHDLDYIFSKSSVLIDHGTDTVVWVMTKHKKVMVIRKNEDSVIFDWNRDVIVMQHAPEPIILNLQTLIEAERIEY